MTQQIADHKKSDKWIPYYFIPFFLIVAIVNAIFVYIAVHSFTGVVTETPYESGLAYNKTLETAEIEASLHLQQSVAFENGQLKWTIYLPDGKPLNNAVVHATFIRAVQAGYDFERDLTNNGKGVYTVEVLPPLAGAWTAKLEATWDKQHYTTTYRFISP